MNCIFWVVCLHQAVVMTGKKQFQLGKEIQGFLTSKNRFVNRIEAMKIAIKIGQVKLENLSNPRIGLFSEDLNYNKIKINFSE